MARTINSNHTAVAPLPSPTSRIPVEYVSASEAAAFVGLSLPTLNAMRRLGKGPDFIQVSKRRVAYELDALRNYMASRTVTSSLV